MFVIGHALLNEIEMVVMNLRGYKAKVRRKLSDFQELATLLPGQFIPSRSDAKTASMCSVNPLNRATSPLFAAFLAGPCHCRRHLNLI